MTFKQSFRFTSLVAITLITATASIYALFSNQTAQAVSPGDWKPGRIIDDAVFFNKDAMSPGQIQDFLNAKIPNCNRWRSTTNTANQPPYTCLKEYQENITTKENNIGRFNSNGTPYQVPGGKSAAQIIWEVGQQYGINPQVLIVMLQKEQSLITDDWPWLVQYQKAMGYACPDTAPCDAQYYGFYNQVSSAAWQMKRYIAYPNSFNFKAGVTRNILWSPNTSCGSSPVFIENAATAALYNYTPYQPNAAAVNNLYGTGDGCSAYGNRNFWRMFNDWFGSSYSDTYKYMAFDLAHSTGALIREVSGGVVYKVIDGYRLTIPSYSVFLSHNYKDTSIKILNRGDITLPISTKLLGYRSGTLIRESGDPKIYAIQCSTQYLDSCTKNHVANYETFTYLGYTESDVSNVIKGEISSIPMGPQIIGRVSHPEGSMVSNPANGKIYLIKNGIRHHITSGLLFELNRFDWSKVKRVNDQDLALPESPYFPEYDTNLLARSIGDPRIYTIGENGYGTTYKKHISTYETFQLLGYTDKDVRLLEPSILNSYVSIPPYPY